MRFNDYPVRPDETDSELVLGGVYYALTSHWRAYFDMPETERLGDINSWDAVLTGVLGELGVGGAFARELCENAKLEAQMLTV